MYSPIAPTSGAAGSTFIELAGHPIRWSLLRELAQSDRKVRELTASPARAPEPGFVPPGPATGGAVGLDAQERCGRT